MSNAKRSFKNSNRPGGAEFFIEPTAKFRERFIVAGGSMKSAIKDLREGEETNDDLINTEEENQSVDLKEDEKLYFGWRNLEFIYRKTQPN